MPQSFAEQLRSIPMSPSLGQSLERAHRSAREQSHRFVTLEHLLLALTEDAEAGLILEAANVDLSRLGTDVSGYLGRLMEDMRAEPGTEPRPEDRKSTRLNSSHVRISYAVFCLKKKKSKLRAAILADRNGSTIDDTA